MGALFGFLTGGPFGALLGFAKSLLGPFTDIFKKIEDTKVQLAQTDNEAKRDALTAKLAVLQSRANLMATEAPLSRLNIYIRSSIGAWVSILLCKILVWDKALGQWTGGHTDKLDPNLWHTVWVVMGFYFVYEGVQIFKK
jgi:hypothetical protein